MDLKDKDKIINEVINEMYLINQPMPLFSISKLLRNKKPHHIGSNIARIIQIMEDEKLINRLDQEHEELTGFGKQIYESGGWLIFADKREREIARRSKKAENDSKISEYLVRTQWWPHWLSGVAIMISAFSLIVSIKQCRQEQIVRVKNEIPINMQMNDSVKLVLGDSLHKK